MSNNHLNIKRWKVIRLEILERDGYRCRKCGKAGRLEVDHVLPIHKGGAVYLESNLQSLCRDCHITKTRNENTKHDPRRLVYDSFVNELL